MHLNIVRMVIVMNRKIIKRLLTYCKPYQLIIIVIFVLSFFSVCLTLLTPVLFGRAIDSLIGINQVDFNTLIVQLMIIVGVIVVCVLVQWLLGQFTNKITYSITNDLRDKVF